MPIRRAWSWALFSGVLSLGPLAGCASTPNPVPVTPLSPAEERVFEHGVDFIAKLDGLEGRWREEWDRDLEQRVSSSDFIAVVTVRTLRTDTAPDQFVTHRLFAAIERTMFGDARSQEVELTVREGAPGFPSINENLNRLADGRFIVYGKWYRTDTDTLATHFHLSPASEEIVRETEGLVAAKNADGPSGGPVTSNPN